MTLGIVAAFLLPRGLPEKYELKNAMVAATIFPKNFVSHHTASGLSTSSVGRYAGTSAQERWYVAKNWPTLITIPILYIMRKKKPAFDGRVHIDLGTYHSLDEGQREKMKVFGLIVNIV